MNILFDQGTPVPLRAALVGHTVETAYERGWSTLSNGDLLTAAETASFDLFITTDQNLRLESPAVRFLPQEESRCRRIGRGEGSAVRYKRD